MNDTRTLVPQWTDAIAPLQPVQRLLIFAPNRRTRDPLRTGTWQRKSMHPQEARQQGTQKPSARANLSLVPPASGSRRRRPARRTAAQVRYLDIAYLAAALLVAVVLWWTSI